MVGNTRSCQTSNMEGLGCVFLDNSRWTEAGEDSRKGSFFSFYNTVDKTTFFPVGNLLLGIFIIAFVYGKTRYRMCAAKKPRLVVALWGDP